MRLYSSKKKKPCCIRSVSDLTAATSAGLLYHFFFLFFSKLYLHNWQLSNTRPSHFDYNLRWRSKVKARKEELSCSRFRRKQSVSWSSSASGQTCCRCSFLKGSEGRRGLKAGAILEAGRCVFGIQTGRQQACCGSAHRLFTFVVPKHERTAVKIDLKWAGGFPLRSEQSRRQVFWKCWTFHRNKCYQIQVSSRRLSARQNH